MASSRRPVVLLLAVACTAAVADEDEALTDMEFLEYLGSWEASDAEWLLLNEPLAAAEVETPTDEDGEPDASEDGDEG